MKEWIKHQGGDISYIDNPQKLLSAKNTRTYVAARDGYIARMQADSIGNASMVLGAGRVKLEDKIEVAI